MTIVRLLQANRRRTVVLDHDAEQIEALRKFGYRVYYGDAARLDLLEAAGAKDAKVFVLAIDDRDRALQIADVRVAALPAPARIRARVRSRARLSAAESRRALGVPRGVRHARSTSRATC